MLRKPLIPVLLLAVLMFSSTFLAIFHQGIAQGTAQVDEIYSSTRLVFRVVPEEGSADSLRLDTFLGDRLREMEEVARSCVMIDCRYSLREPVPMPGVAVAYGTDDPEALAQAMDFTLELGQEGFQTDSCIVDEAMARELGLQPGDSLVIAGSEYMGEDPEKAPAIALTMAGTCSGLGEKAIIVHCERFLAQPRLLYNSNMMYNCFYNYCSLEIDPAYNRDFLRVRDKVEEALGTRDKLTVVTNIRALEQTVGSLERKLQIQRLVAAPLTAVLWIASGVVAMLLGLSFQTEVFLRLLWGEKRWRVFLRLTANVLGLLALGGAGGMALVWLTAGSGWLEWAGDWLAAAGGLCALTATIPLAMACGRNLIRSYQSREG